MAVAMVAQAGMQMIESAQLAGDMRADAAAELKLKNEATFNQQLENNQAAALDNLNAQRETMRRLATSTAGAGEAGVGGNSVLREFATVELQGAYDEGIIESNKVSANRAAELSAQADTARYSSQMRNAKRTEGSVGANMVGLGAAGLQGYVAGGGKLG